LGRIVKVECHSGYSYAERPIAIETGGLRMDIEEILNEATTPEGRFFKVKIFDGRVIDLEYDEAKDEWKASE